MFLTRSRRAGHVAAGALALAIMTTACAPPGDDVPSDAGPDPRHAETCDAAPSAECTPADNNGDGACTTDADCPTGACVDYYDGCFCGRADCTHDDDCADGFACACAAVIGMNRNACVEAECRADADCASGHCQVSLGGLDCCDSGEVLGFFCTSADDECTGCDHCRFDEDTGHFVCADPGGCTCD